MRLSDERTSDDGGRTGMTIPFARSAGFRGTEIRKGEQTGFLGRVLNIPMTAILRPIPPFFRPRRRSDRPQRVIFGKKGKVALWASYGSTGDFSFRPISHRFSDRSRAEWPGGGR